MGDKVAAARGGAVCKAGSAAARAGSNARLVQKPAAAITCTLLLWPPGFLQSPDRRWRKLWRAGKTAAVRAAAVDALAALAFVAGEEPDDTDEVLALLAALWQTGACWEKAF